MVKHFEWYLHYDFGAAGWFAGGTVHFSFRSRLVLFYERLGRIPQMDPFLLGGLECKIRQELKVYTDLARRVSSPFDSEGNSGILGLPKCVGAK